MRQKEKRRRGRAAMTIEADRMERHVGGECRRVACSSCGLSFDRCPFEGRSAQKKWGAKSITRCHQCWGKP